MVGDYDADVLVLECGDDALYILHGYGVDSGEWFVEKYERRVYRHGACNLGTAALASRELDAEALAHLLQTELLDERLAPLGLILLAVCRHLEYGAYVVFDAQTAEYRGLLCQISDTHLCASVDGFVGQFDDLLVVLFEEDLAFVGGYQPHDHIKGSGLAGTVGAEQSDDLTLVDVDRDVIHDRA